MNDLPPYFTVPELARHTRLGEDRIRNLIRSGRLAAANLNPNGRPFWKIRREDWEACWASMSAGRTPPAPRSHRPRPPANVIEFI